MVLGLIGAGNMARGLALGWGRPCCAPTWWPSARRRWPTRSAARRWPPTPRSRSAPTSSSSATSRRSSRRWRPRSRRTPRRVVSILAATPLADVKAAYPDRPVYRILPSTPVEVRQGAVILAADDEQDAELDAAVRELLEELGTLVVLDDAMVDVAMGLMSNAPAYYALVVEAQVDAGVRHGLTADQASRLVVQTMAGTAELLRRQGYDTLAVRRAVTSPGGSTARGLDALERGGLRAAFSDALDAILKR